MKFGARRKSTADRGIRCQPVRSSTGAKKDFSELLIISIESFRHLRTDNEDFKVRRIELRVGRLDVDSGRNPIHFEQSFLRLGGKEEIYKQFRSIRMWRFGEQVEPHDRCGNVALLIPRGDSHPKRLHHFGFQVDSIEATQKRLKEIEDPLPGVAFDEYKVKIPKEIHLIFLKRAGKPEGNHN